MKKLIPLTSLLLLAIANLHAQDTSPKKLPTIQEGNTRAPANVKIDGKLTEWNDSFQAYNKVTHLYYTVANDDKNLYLIIKTSDATTNAKITAGGITLAINTEGKKKDKDVYSLTYPIIPRNTGRPAGGNFNTVGGGGGVRTMSVMIGGPGGGQRGSAPDSAMIKAAHERTVNAAKEIKVSGFKDITDSLIAIYNEYDIKATIGYDKEGSFVYELAVPLKLLSMAADSKNEIAYNIKLNGLQLNFRMPDNAEGPPAGGGAPGGGMRVMTFGGPPGGGKGGIDFQELTSASDFWGKYTLAKK
ncbi:MAG: hypothetical protein V4560_15810 [Bacteroidota bacterium]